MGFIFTPCIDFTGGTFAMPVVIPFRIIKLITNVEDDTQILIPYSYLELTWPNRKVDQGHIIHLLEI